MFQFEQNIQILMKLLLFHILLILIFLKIFGDNVKRYLLNIEVENAASNILWSY